MSHWIIINEFISHNKPHIVGAITPILMVVVSYIEIISEWVRLFGLLVGLVVGVLTGIKLVLEIRQSQKDEADK